MADLSLNAQQRTGVKPFWVVLLVLAGVVLLLAAALGVTPQALSYHLAKLKKADLIYETRYKNFIYYELNLSILDETILWMNELRGGTDCEN